MGTKNDKITQSGSSSTPQSPTSESRSMSVTSLPSPGSKSPVSRSASKKESDPFGGGPLTAFSIERVIEVSGNTPPFMEKFSENPSILISGKGLELSCPGYSYNYVTARGSVKVLKGRWYYEILFKNSGPARIGWCSTNYISTSQNIAIGTDENSWGYDGSQQRKFHKSTAGEIYGEYWNAGDVIGSILDFTLRRIIFTKNGKDLGIAFNNVRAESGLYPAISFAGGARVIVNFGRAFLYPVLGTPGLNPSMTRDQKQSVNQIFLDYANNPEDPNSDISGENLLRLGRDLGLEDPGSDPLLLLLAWRFHSSHQWSIQKSEWMASWALSGTCTLSEMKTCIKKWKSELSEDEGIFRNFYAFVFEYLKVSPTATVLETSEALMAWRLCGLDKRWGLFGEWENYWKNCSAKGVSKDTWNMLLLFMEAIGDDMNKYDVNDCWPTAFDDFVEKLKK